MKSRFTSEVYLEKMSAAGCLMWCRSLNKNAKKAHYLATSILRRYIADLTVNQKVKIDPGVKTALENGTIKSPKKHPGLVTVRAVKLPKELAKSMEVLLEKYPVKDVKSKAEELYRYLWSRKLKQPYQSVTQRAAEIRLFYFNKEQKKRDIESLSSSEKSNIMDEIEEKVKNRIHRETYNWESVGYDAFKSLKYMLSRMPKEYSVLYQIFSEILKRDSGFRPQTMMDFGSGVGSAIWASQAVWPKSVFEYMCVEPSIDMNTLSRLLLQGGSEQADMLYKGVHHLHYYPISNTHKYDLVVSGFTFIELGTLAERMQTLLSLWEKTEKYLVLVENGTNAGFQLVSEARDFLLQVSAERSVPELVGHVFAPCPHDKLCPRGLRNDGTPCNFEVVTDNLPQNLQMADKKPFRYSYVVLKKGERDASVPAWPRLVRPTSAPSKRVHCRTCTANADLEKTVITASKHGRELLRCARACRWGDLVPMMTDTEADPGQGDEETIIEEALMPSTEEEDSTAGNTDTKGLNSHSNTEQELHFDSDTHNISRIFEYEETISERSFTLPAAYGSVEAGQNDTEEGNNISMRNTSISHKDEDFVCDNNNKTSASRVFNYDDMF